MSTLNFSALPTLSVILPNYNHAEYLPDSLGAILGQSVRPLEVLVYDDGSTDDSVRIIREFADRDPIVRLVADTRRAGPNVNLNRGFREAKGDFVYAAAADDQVLEGFFEKALSLLASHPGAKICVADLAQFDAITGKVRYLRPRLSPRASYVTPEEVVQRLARKHVHIYGGMTIFNRTSLVELGGFAPDLKWYADWFCALVFTIRYGTCYLPQAAQAMRMLPGSYSAAGARSTAAQDALFRLIFDTLRKDEYADVWVPILESGALCVLGSQILRVILTEPRYRDILSIRLLMRLLANIPVTLSGLNPATPSPFKFLDKAVRSSLRLDDRIQRYGVHVGNSNGSS
jgi:glycosyltransferase involved in cell wall biosynthesis